MKENFDAIIFDVDGTIWNTTDLVAQGYNIVFERENLPLRIDGSRLRELFGRTMDAIFEALLPEESYERRKELYLQCLEEEDRLLEEQPGVWFPEICQVMEKLAERYPLYIVSNCQSGYIETVIRWGNLQNAIKGHLCFGDTGVGKGQTMKILMEKEGLRNPVYVGDIQGDADACAEAGIPIIYASYGFGKVKDPYAVIQAPVDLLKVL